MTLVSAATQTKLPLTEALSRIKRNSTLFNGRFPNSGSGLHYTLNDNVNWLAAFWPGMLWLAAAYSNDPIYRQTAVSLLPSFHNRLNKQIHITHDLGFLYTLSARAQWQLTGDEAARQLALRAAGELARRFREPGQYIQAWKAVGDPEEGGRIIADTMMNLPLLFWAGAQTGNGRYHEIARRHARTSRQYLIRPDGSSFHTFFFDQKTGRPLAGRTHQGYSDDSLWARGQAWLIYGFALAAQWCAEPAFLAAARQTAVTFLAELPEDKIPPWDLRLPPGELPYRDSSAAAIAACGLLRLAQLDDDPALYAQGEALVEALINCCWETNPDGEGLLKHGALHVPKGWATDEYLIVGDYFFLEALLTLENKTPDFWGPAGKE